MLKNLRELIFKTLLILAILFLSYFLFKLCDQLEYANRTMSSIDVKLNGVTDIAERIEEISDAFKYFEGEYDVEILYDN